jgi:PAS domain S-box-containing protein
MDTDNSTSCNLLALQSSTFPYTFSQMLYTKDNQPIDFFILDANEAFAKLLNLNREEVINHKASDFFSDLLLTDNHWLKIYSRVAQSGKPEEYEDFSPSLNKWFNLSITCPRKGHFVILSVDITDRKNAEAKLILSEQLNSIYFNNTPDGIIITDQKGIIQKINHSFSKLIDRAESEIIGKLLTSVVQTSGTYDFEDICKNKKNEQKKQRVFVIQNSSKTILEDIAVLPLHQVLFIWKDISENIQNKIEKNLYVSVFDKIAQNIIICERDLSISDINESFSNFSGYSIDDLRDKTVRDLLCDEITYRQFGFPDGYISKMQRMILADIFNNDKKHSEVELLFKNKNGESIWAYVVVSGFFDENKCLNKILFFPVDISKRHDIEETTRLELYQTLADLAELRDDDTGNHMKRIGVFASLIAKKLNMDTKFCHDIEVFAPLHDIGKVGIVDSILLKADEFSEAEQKIMRTHTTLGYNIVKTKSKLGMVADITLNHHERFDGEGYPNKLFGYAIPLAAQITAIVDVYDALRSNRPYKKSWDHQTTINYIRDNCGSAFTPEIVETFLQVEKEFENIFNQMNGL